MASTAFVLDNPHANLSDENVFSALYNQARNKLFHLTKSILRNDQDAEEAVQDAFLNAYRARRRFDHRSTPLTWLYKIAKNAALDRVRKAERRPEGYRVDIPEGEEGGQDRLFVAEPNQLTGAIAGERKDLTVEAINKLPEHQRVPVLLKECEELSIHEISAALDRNKNTLKVEIFRGKQKLRPRLLEAGMQSQGVPDRPALPARSTHCPPLP